MMFNLVLSEMLNDLGCHQVLSAATEAEALENLAKSTIDFALVDLYLDRDTSLPVMDQLAAEKIPFAVMSGADKEDLPPQCASYPFLQKPFFLDDVRRALCTYQHRSSS